ncbi:MAG: hypothetical protein ACYCW6_12700, partial [Candidatus Xenobia bacterium]
VEAATMYAAQVLEEVGYDARTGNLTPGPLPTPVKITLQTTDYQVTRNVTALDAADAPPRLYQVDVAVSWNDQPVPVRLSTRLYLGQ